MNCRIYLITELMQSVYWLTEFNCGIIFIDVANIEFDFVL